MGEGRTQTTSDFGSMSLLSRMAFRTAEPSLPVTLVRASIIVNDSSIWSTFLVVFLGKILKCQSLNGTLWSKYVSIEMLVWMISFLSKETNRGILQLQGMTQGRDPGNNRKANNCIW
jgi:hypothetical protein